MNKEEYKKEIVRMWDSLRDDKYKGYHDYNSEMCECSGVQCCEKCALYGVDCGSSTNAFEMIEAVEKWSKEHPQKHKISQLEYDILEKFANSGFACYFSEYNLLMSLLKKGYFKGADEKMNIDYYFNHCEVADDEG